MVLKESDDYVQQGNSAYWSALAQERKGVYEAIFRSLEKVSFFDGASSALDIGCGPGLLLSVLHRAHPQMVLAGMDISGEMLAIAEKENLGNERVSFHEQDITADPLESRFDRIISVDSLYLWKEKAPGLRNAYAMLNEGGRACFVNPNGDYSLDKLEQLHLAPRQKEVLSFAVEGGLTIEQIADLAREAGITGLTFSYSGTLPEAPERAERLRQRVPFFYAFFEKPRGNA